MADEGTRPAKPGDTTTSSAHASPSAAASGSASSLTSGPAPAADAALQVIILGSQGGPLETNCTAFLVRSLATGWRKGSLMAVDAGVHLGAITQILENTQPPNLGESKELALPYELRTGPFAGLKVHSASAKTNAARIQGDLIDTYLITHPHLDHISGFVINTAGLAGPRRKKLAGLPTTIQALKTHIFNNVIWPNLSDEDHGAGLFTYMRLNEGGFPGMGNVDGYLEFNEGLAVKTWSVSHGHLVERQPHRGSAPNTRFGSLDAPTGTLGFNIGMLSPRSIAHNNASPNLPGYFQQHPVNAPHERAQSIMPLPGSGGPPGTRAPVGMNLNSNPSPTEVPYVYDSSSYFIRDVETGVEVLIFGDVESDSISMHPRNLHIWQEAAPKVAEGKLKAILIECSYDDSRPMDRLFGHLTPSFLIEEMMVLANEVKRHRIRQAMARAKEAEETRRTVKRKREGGNEMTIAGRRRATRALTRDWTSTTPGEDPISPRTVKAQWLTGSQGTGRSEGEGSGGTESPPARSRTPVGQTSLDPAQPASAAAEQAVATAAAAAEAEENDRPQLEGVKVVIIHMKDTMNDDQPVGEIIHEELLEHETFMETPLGCEWVISEVGQSLML
ncbi:cAMP phosphodiesterases class-II-domain-containing protein [Coniella lustricola]|uniref:cAMP phosphodiesterases class-II-domain-containing protein n=1 Tax=Coniella lustricola TaxID=2025994 RepID=A0A2T2ZSP3_9PEZI|nr:cAMP phosphodiesterases class-II-domain-containing protein [Coniella lustricola]